MRKFIAGIFGAVLTCISFSATAAPNLYTFSGSISYIEVDGAYLSDIDFDGDLLTSNDTFKVGDTIEYTFLVDFDVPGFCSGPLGTTYSSTCTGANIPDSVLANYFFTTLVSATKLAPATEEGTTFNYGLSLSNLGSLVADSAVFIVSPYNESVEGWVASTPSVPGSMLIGTDAWAGPNGSGPYGRINSLLTLTSITPVVVDVPDGECAIDSEDEKNEEDHEDEYREDHHKKHDKHKRKKRTHKEKNKRHESHDHGDRDDKHARHSDGKHKHHHVDEIEDEKDEASHDDQDSECGENDSDNDRDNSNHDDDVPKKHGEHHTNNHHHDNKSYRGKHTESGKYKHIRIKKHSKLKLSKNKYKNKNKKSGEKHKRRYRDKKEHAS